MDGRAPETDRSESRGGRLAELALLYFALPGTLTLARLFVRTFPVIPVLWIVAFPIAFWLVARRGFRPADLFAFGSAPIRGREVARIFLRAVPATALLVGLLYALRPDWILSLPQDRPALWALVTVAYPVLSVVPQGILYRAFFRERYGALFRNRRARAVAAALCFSFSHVFFLNPWALLLTFVGGLFFQGTYERTGSLFLSNLEHALYGDLVLTIGYGAFLYHGTLSMAAGALG